MVYGPENLVKFNKMFIQKLKDLCCGNLSVKAKILVTISLAWIIIVGYLIWWNGLNNPTGDRSFRWDEWIWFGVVPATIPYLFYFIWKKDKNNK